MIAGAGGKKAAELLPALVLRRRLLGGLKRLRAALGNHSSGEVGKLLRLKREQLVTGLRCRKAAVADWLDVTSADI